MTFHSFSKSIAAIGSLGLAFCAVATTASAQDNEQPYPLDYWSIRSTVSSVTVSPDGEHLALLAIKSKDGNPVLEIYETDDLTKQPIRLAADPMEFTGVSWVSDENLVINARQKVRKKIQGYNQGVYEFRLVGYNIERKKFSKFGTNFGIASLLPNEPDTILVESSRTVDNRIEGDPFANFRPRAYYRLNLKTGRTSLVIKGSENFGQASFDRDGNPRFTQGFDDPNNELVYYYRKPGDSRWTEFLRLSEEDQFSNNVALAAFDPDNTSKAFLIANNGHNQAGLWEFDFDTGEFGELIYRRDDAEVIGTVSAPNFWGGDEGIVGAVYPGTKYEVHFFDEDYKRQIENLERAIPNAYSVSIGSMSRDGSKYVVTNRGPKDPGSFWLVNNGTMALIGSANPLLKAEHLATIEHFRYPARDGRMIPGHITIPARGEPPYPLIVMPHGGPYVNVIPVFDEWGQMFANNGYMVFEPNYRGSTGYGVDHFLSSLNEHGYAMQDDKDDGALYLVEQGLADPDRIAMFGWSYGGYAALVAASRDPNIYQCTIAGAAVADPWMQYNYRRGEPGSLSDEFGRQRATGIRPIEEVEKINIPLLMIHGDVDQRVPFEHYTKYKPLVERAGKDAQFVVLEGADHFSNTLFYEHQIKLYTSMINYLKNDCGPGGL